MSGYIYSNLGPGSVGLSRDVIDSRSEVTRAGQQTQSAFVDPFAWNTVIEKARGGTPTCPFYEWATVQVGFVCVMSKNSSAAYYRHRETEKAFPIIACGEYMSAGDHKNYQFAGVAMTPSVRDYDDVQNGMKRDEYFTLAMEGKATLLNNGTKTIKRGDQVEWAFESSDGAESGSVKRQRGPRRIIVQPAATTERAIGRALSTAVKGHNFDILLKFA